MNRLRFITLVFQMYLVLKLYDIWHFITGLNWRTYTIITILLFYGVISLIDKYGVGRNWKSMLPFKVIPKYSKTSNAINLLFLATACMIGGFALGHHLLGYSKAFSILAVYIAAQILMRKVRKYQYVGWAFFYGILFTLDIFNHYAIFTFFIIGNFIIYLMGDTGQF